MKSLRARARSPRSQRGAVFVEIIIILPMLLVISLGVFDLGLAWRTSMTVTSAARAGARVASNLGIATTTDQQALMSIAASMSTIPVAEIDAVVIYKSTTSTGDVPANCLSASVKSAGGSATDMCNVYTGAEVMASSSSSAFTGNCSTSRDRFWCPSTRANSQIIATGPDYVGVYVRVNHATKTKIFGSSMVLKDKAVMRIEPNAGNP